MKFYDIIEFNDVKFFDSKMTTPLKILRNLNKNSILLLIFSELKKCYKLIYSDVLNVLRYIRLCKIHSDMF